MSDPFQQTSALSNAELDRALEDAVVQSMDAEKLICVYLSAVREREAYSEFGFTNIYDYAYERFGFSERKTRYLVSLGRRLAELPKLRAALRDGKIGWVKASRVASVAKTEDEAMWLDTALSLSVRDLERRIKDGTDSTASTIHFWMAETQRDTWENALELCRRLSGSQISPGEALELIAGDFIATYAHLLRDEDQENDSARVEVRGPGSDTAVCPESDDELPTPFDVVYDDVTLAVFERDGYRCRYPGCTARSQLHAHHIQFRSRGGPDTLSNLVTVCAPHHRMIHGNVIGVSGRSPFELDWQPPRLMELALARRPRNRLYVGELDLRRWPHSGKRVPEAAGVM